MTKQQEEREYSEKNYAAGWITPSKQKVVKFLQWIVTPRYHEVNTRGEEQ